MAGPYAARDVLHFPLDSRELPLCHADFRIESKLAGILI
jgi:hypothetical protein